MSSVIGKAVDQGHLTEDEVREYAYQALSGYDVDGKRVLVIIPDLSRNAPVSLFFRLLYEILGAQTKSLDYLVALGTHRPLSMERIAERVGVSVAGLKQEYGKIRFFNHAHDDPGELTVIGSMSEGEIFEISNGLMREEVQVTVNKRVFEYDLLIIISPVVPHEIAGFSGGNKYLFPGIAGADMIHFFHWLAAVITNPVVNGTKANPVRRFLNRAASFLQVPRVCFNMVIHEGKLKGLFIGDVETSWAKAADLSAKLHIYYVDKPFQKVLGSAPSYYDELWTAGKVMYKLEPIVADGGELTIYAPHVKEISYTYGKLLRRIGYHVRDYYLKQMGRFSDIPRGVMAHSTQVKGIGTFYKGLERPRINVVLATGISEDTCRKINLGYLDPRTINLDDWKGREDEGILCVENAGGRLYRLR